MPDYRRKPSMYLSQNSEESGNRKSSFIILIKADLHNLKLLSGFEICVQAVSYKHPNYQSIFNREKPVFITGIPANENRIFPVWKYYTGKA